MAKFQEQLDAVLAFHLPQHDAQTVHDHEEWSRYYLGLLTNEEYLKLRRWACDPDNQFGRSPWAHLFYSDAELLRKARNHAEAARIIKELDDLHEGDEDGA